MRHHLFIWGFVGLCAAACVEDPNTSSDPNDGDAATVDMLVDAATPDAAPMPDAAPLDMTPTPDGGMLCFMDQDCEGGTCEDGRCTDPECRADPDCPQPMLQACRDFVCRDRCLGMSCIRGGICVDGACVPDECTVDGDCPDEELCREGRCVEAQPCAENVDCEPDGRCIEGNCEPLTICAGDRNCAEDEICQEGRCRPQPSCEARPDCGEGEDCVAGRCVPFVCRGEGDCPEGELCRAGACEEPEIAAVAEVVILTRARSLAVGERLRVRAVGLDLRGDVVVVSGFTWSADGPAVIGPDGLLTAGMEAGAVSVVASYEGDDGLIESAPLVLTIEALEAPVERRVRITDANSGEPVGGATIRVGDESLLTDDDGVAEFAVEAPYTVSVFAADYDYITVVDLDLADVRLQLTARSGNERSAGFTGRLDFDQVQSEGEVDLGLAGGSIAGGLTHIDLGRVLGQIFNVAVSAGPFDFDIPLPGGLTLAAEVPFLGQLRVKDDYFVTAGGGFQFAWAFAGRIDIGTIIALFQGGGGGGFNVGQVLATLLPFFDQFQHGLRVDELVALPRQPDADDVDGDGDEEELVPDYERFPVLNVEPDQSQQLRVSVSVADPDTLPGEGSPVALVFAGSEVDGVGFVPLGLSSTDEAAVLPIRQAAPYGGLEVGQPVLIALAARFGGGNFLPEDLSGRLVRFPGLLPPEVELGPFLANPEQARWQPALRRLDAGAVDGAGVHRAVFAGPAGRWTVWFTGAPEASLPFPPDGAADLAAGAEVRVEALSLETDLDTLLAPGGGQLVDVDLVTSAFSRATATQE